MNRLYCVFLTAALGLSTSALWADSFGSGANSFDVEFVTIGNPGNPPDANPNPAGAVPYSYRIGKYEISEQMIDKANALGGLGITNNTRGPDYPATNITWFEAATFVNWLNRSTGNAPAYKFDSRSDFQLWQPGDPGYDPNNLFRNSLAIYFLPSVNEWYKAAYYDPSSETYFDYPTGSDIPPIAVASGTAAGSAVYNQDFSAGPAEIMMAGGLSPYGTMAQGGNTDELEETEFDLTNDSIAGDRGRRGGSWFNSSVFLRAPSRQPESPFPTAISSGGFRVGSTVTEPSSAVLLGSGLIALFKITRRRKEDKQKDRQIKGSERSELFI
jgi:hypothetical protein